MFSHATISLLIFALQVFAISFEASGDSIVVKTESSNAFTVTIDWDNCDITSILYDGDEYQYSGTSSHIASGLGSEASVKYSQKGDYVVVSCDIDDDEFNLIHYYVFADGQDAIYMGTNTVEEPSVGELRYIGRLLHVPEGYKEGDVSATDGGEAIEASDVYLVDGETRSKFYSSERFIDDQVHCGFASDSSVYACMLLSDQSYEKSSGGPFHRDINLNYVGDYQSLTFYMNSGHVATEDNRMGFHGPYVMSFTDHIPTVDEFDPSFFEDLDLEGYVGPSSRGRVKGTTSGTSRYVDTVVHWYNDNYQYWTYATDNAFTSPAMSAGTYTMALYQGELLAATKIVSVSAGKTATASISATNAIITDTGRTTLFQLGTYDGQPFEFLNGDKFLRMHPSDDRMSDWSPGSIARTDGAAAFPMAIFKDLNSPTNITFSLTAVPSTAPTLRIATTLAFAGARSSIKLGHYSSSLPSAPSEIDSRGVTRGAYRGYGEVYEYTIPTSALVVGTNRLAIGVNSGSSGEDYLSPNVIIDAIELYY